MPVYSTSFIRSFRGLMDLEGWSAYSNHPGDVGGETKYGISKLAYPDEDIRGMTEDRAMKLYHRDWWEPVWGDAIKDPAIAFQLFETAVHMDARLAPRRSVKIAQGALIIHGVEVVFDGFMGWETCRAINAYPHKPSLLKWMNLIQGAALMVGVAGEQQLIMLVKDRLKQLKTFGRGWGRRIEI